MTKGTVYPTCKTQESILPDFKNCGFLHMAFCCTYYSDHVY